jgi:acetolactate decarboxylase
MQAPFFGYTHVAQWRQQPLPDSVQSIAQLEAWLLTIAGSNQTFAFRLKGKVQAATIHVVNLPAGTTVSSPDDAHQGQRRFRLQNLEAEVLGFFSTRHQAVFMHHDSFLHMHLISADKKWMGHVDALLLQPGAIQLLLPADVSVR